MRLVTALLLVFAAIGLAPAPARAAQPAKAPVQVMVLGSYHFDNPGLDIANVKSEDVLTPQRQRELAALAEAIARWHPTKIMVERVVETPDLVDPVYARFTPAMLAAQRDERVQIAYRAAALAKLPRVYGIDEQPSAGEPDYFPFDKVAAYAQAHGMTDKLDAMTGAVGSELKEFEAMQATQSMPRLLAWHNRHSGFNAGMAGYYRLLSIGDTQDQPGADLNAMWYLRNAKIFAKLVHLAEPGDRVLVVYGAGHGYWLRHFATETAGFTNVDPLPLLDAAAKAVAKKR